MTFFLRNNLNVFFRHQGRATKHKWGSFGRYSALLLIRRLSGEHLNFGQAIRYHSSLAHQVSEEVPAEVSRQIFHDQKFFSIRPKILHVWTISILEALVFAPWSGFVAWAPPLRAHAGPSTHRPKGGNKGQKEDADLKLRSGLAWGQKWVEIVTYAFLLSSNVRHLDWNLNETLYRE